MSEMPWIRFFPSDWLAGTRGMTAAETGIYITLIATMYERKEPIPEDHKRLARLCGATVSTFRQVIDALTLDDKIQRTESGLWNERVEKEINFRDEKSEVGRQAADARWSKKSNKNKRQNDANAMQAQSERNANQKSEAREDVNTSSNVRAKSEFDLWYEHYPHKVQRGAAEKAFPKALKQSSLQNLIDGVQRYIASKPSDRAFQNPATWLNGKGWLDQPATVSARGSPPPFQRPETPSQFAARLARGEENEDRQPNQSEHNLRLVGSVSTTNGW